MMYKVQLKSEEPSLLTALLIILSLNQLEVWSLKCQEAVKRAKMFSNADSDTLGLLAQTDQKSNTHMKPVYKDVNLRKAANSTISEAGTKKIFGSFAKEIACMNNK